MCSSADSLEDNVGGATPTLDRANRLTLEGEFDDATAAYLDVVQQLRSAGYSWSATPDLRSDLRMAVEGSLELMRWKQDQSAALELLGIVGVLDPELGEEFTADRARLLLETGRVEEGIAELERLAESEPRSPWVWTLLGVANMEGGRYPEAERCLFYANGVHVSSSDRAQTYWLLVELHRRRRDPAGMEAAWRLACGCDPAFESRLPTVARTLIDMRYFDRAALYLESEHNEARRCFYYGLIEYSGGGDGNYRAAEELWRKIADREVVGADECPDECAEACLYLGRPQDALDRLKPLAFQADSDVWRMLLFGFTYALLGDVPRARVHLDAAVGLADGKWPRQTRAGTGAQRILSQQARVAYGNIIKATDVRAELDRYFIPLPA